MATTEKVIINAMPIWDPSVWEHLQQKKYKEAEQSLRKILGSFTPDEWGNVQWAEILEGAPAFRGKLSEAEWRMSALYSIVKAVFEAADASALQNAYDSLTPNDQIHFHEEISRVIPGATSDQKLDWIKKHKPLLYPFFTSKPTYAPIEKSTEKLSEPSVQPRPTPPSLPPQSSRPTQMFKVPVDVGPMAPEEEGPRTVHYEGETTPLK